MRTNAQGFRCDHDFGAPRPDGVFRVALFGDSYSAGEGVSNGHRFGDLLEKQLDDVQMLNFALPGTGTSAPGRARLLNSSKDGRIISGCPYFVATPSPANAISPASSTMR